MKLKIILLFFMIILFIPSSINTIYTFNNDFNTTFQTSLSKVVFKIKWENINNTAEVILINPRGEKYSSKNRYDKFLFTIRKGEIEIFVDNCERGEWKINVYGNDLGKIIAMMS